MLNIRDILIENGIDENILNHAKKMDIDLVELFKNKIFNNYTDKTFDEVKSHLMGVYGNYYATMYYVGMGKHVKNEYPIYQDGKEVMKADLEFEDENVKTYVEVKLTKQILRDRFHYVDDKRTLFIINKDYRKYEEIGKKLIKQVNKLINNGKVIVCVFSDTIIDDDIRTELENLGAQLKILAQKVYDVEENIISIINNIKDEYEKLNNKRLAA